MRNGGLLCKTVYNIVVKYVYYCKRIQAVKSEEELVGLCKWGNLFDWLWWPGVTDHSMEVEGEMKRLLSLRLVAVLLTVLLIGLYSSTVFAKVYKWKMQAFIPEPVLWYQGFMVPFLEEIKKRTDGQLVIEGYGAGSIVAPNQMLEAVSEGVLECALGTTGYDTGVIPEAYAPTNLPYGFEGIGQAEEFWKVGGEPWQILDKVYQQKNIKLITLLFAPDPSVFMTMFSINSAADFKGKKIRSSGQWATMVANTGASQVTMGLGEVYQSLERGVIDGTLMNFSGLTDFKWNEIVKCVSMPPVISGGTADVRVNVDAFNELPAELQKIFVETVIDIGKNNLGPYVADYTAKVDAEAKAKGVEFITLPEEEIAHLRKASLSMWQRVEGLNANTARQIELMKKYLDEKGIEYPK